MGASSAAIYGLSGLHLTEAERDFFRDSASWGFILFARNIETPEQVRRLTGDLRDAVGRNAPILIDQEGGRVQQKNFENDFPHHFIIPNRCCDSELFP